MNTAKTRDKQRVSTQTPEGRVAVVMEAMGYEVIDEVDTRVFFTDEYNRSQKSVMARYNRTVFLLRREGKFYAVWVGHNGGWTDPTRVGQFGRLPSYFTVPDDFPTGCA